MKIKFLELDLAWPCEITVIELKNYILSELIKYGEPLRWAITSITNNPGEKNQIISIEVVLIIYQEKGKSINAELN